MKLRRLVDYLPFVALASIPVGEVLAVCRSVTTRDCQYAVTTYDYGSTTRQEVTSTCGPWTSTQSCTPDTPPAGGGVGGPAPDPSVPPMSEPPGAPPDIDCNCAERCRIDGLAAAFDCRVKGSKDAAFLCVHGTWPGGEAGLAGSTRVRYECSDKDCLRWRWNDVEPCNPQPGLEPGIEYCLKDPPVVCKDEVTVPDTYCRNVYVPGNINCHNAFMDGVPGVNKGSGITAGIAFGKNTGVVQGGVEVTSYTEYNVNAIDGINRTCTQGSHNAVNDCRTTRQCDPRC